MSWESLAEIGLQEKEAKTLHALLRLEEAKASEIAKASGISRVRTYDILKDLYSKGLIRKKEGRPTKYIALSPEETIQKFLNWKEEKYKEEKEKIMEKKEEVEKDLKESKEIDEEKRPKHILEFLSLGDVSEQETRNVIKNSEDEVKIMSESLEWIDSIQDELEKTDSEIKVLMQKKENIDQRAKKAQKKAVKILEDLDTEVVFTDEMPLRGCMSNKEAVINVKEKESSNLLRDCIYTNHQSFVRALNIYFDGLWE
ncbi:MAG: TrmB family transcriptional regulator [Candidatus Aenigmatarchaeota archaeon]